MLTKHLIPALAAIGSAAAQCSKATTTIENPTQATELAGACQTYKGTIVIGEDTGNKIDLSGIRQITGDLIVLNNEGITELSSTDLSSVGGTFQLQNLTIITSVLMPSLSKVNEILFQSLPALGSLTFGPPGVTEAKSVIISDTFLSSLKGIDVRDVEVMDINNNRRLKDFTTALKTVSGSLKISANNKDMAVSMVNVKWVNNMEIANVTTFEAPSLATVNGSARFDSNYFDSFIAPNLTSTQKGDISFVGNSELTNITLSSLKSVAGGLLIANNTALEKVDGFQKLQEVGGALKMRGNFTDVEFPELEDVKGAFDVVSTTDIDAACESFSDLKKGGQIQGTYKCESDNPEANEDTSTGTSGGKGGGDKEDAATGLVLNTAFLAVSAFVGFTMLL